MMAMSRGQKLAVMSKSNTKPNDYVSDWVKNSSQEVCCFDLFHNLKSLVNHLTFRAQAVYLSSVVILRVPGPMANKITEDV
jgi:hypothetical protein